MSGQIRAEEGSLQRGAEAVIGAHGDIVASIKRVEDRLEDLSAAWSGQAATAYNSMLTQWSNDAERLSRMLVTLSEELRSTEEGFARTEENAGSVISNLGSMMGQNIV